MRIAICEDNKELNLELVRQLQEQDEEHRYRMHQYYSGDEMWFHYQDKPQPYDLILLDIELPGELNGLEVARRIREAGDYVCIVILTAHREYALEGYSVQPLDYLVKPVSPDALAAIVRKAEDRMRRHWDQSLNLPENGGYVRIPFHEILYMESQGHFVFITTRQGVYRRYCKLSELLEHCDERFLCPHKSFVINADWLRRTSNQYTALEMHDGWSCPISKHKKREFLLALAQYDDMFSRLRA